MIPSYFNLVLRKNSFWLLPERAVFWPEPKVLICSDLHWGRELFLQKHGMPVPEIRHFQERTVIENLIERLKPSEWWILGDFIHQPLGMPDLFWNELNLWCEKLLDSSLSLTKICLVPGNHDRGYLTWSKKLPISVYPNGIHRDCFSFSHEPEPKSQKNKLYGVSPVFSWYGHLHPAISLSLIGQKKLPCFWVRENEAYLPAFSRLAGGHEINLRRAHERAIAIGEGRIFEC